uniref:Uncharacterized protein n=1 Tax=Aegilops tauschii TaxID=37682 RepID=M8C021_AEGTA
MVISVSFSPCVPFMEANLNRRITKSDYFIYRPLRCMPVTTKQDRVFDKVFRAMRSDQDGIIVYRDGTLDEATFAAVCSEHTPIEDVGYHVIPGSVCSEFGYLRHSKIHGGNFDEETCKGYPGHKDVVRLKDLSPRSCRNMWV